MTDSKTDAISPNHGGSEMPIGHPRAERDARIIHDPFLGKNVVIIDRLVDRLRGNYACGPHLPNGRPEFGFRQFQAPPIQHEAAAVIETMVKALQKIADLVDSEADEPLDDAIKIANDALKATGYSDDR